MTLLPDWEPLHVSGIFTPAILICDQEKETEDEETSSKLGTYRELFYNKDEVQEKEKFKNLGTYREMFYENDVLQKRVILLGEAGAGKTTFIKHLTDVWSEKSTEPQFSDVGEVKQFQYFFYVSCRFAEEKETILDMINNQLFEDETIKAVAIYMLKHHPECCIIVVDGVDEWKGSPTSETGRRGDIAGLPSMTGVEGCVILITARPWRFHALSTKARGIFRLLKISGIKNVQELAYRILEQLEDPDPKQSSYQFLRQIGEKNMSALMKIPLILIIALGGWVDGKSLHRSITVNYINMIQSFIGRSKGQAGWSSSESKLRQLVPHLETLETAWGEKSNELPHLLSKYQSIRRYAGLFLSLGQLAFDLLLGKEEQSLVFSKKVSKSYLPADDENDESVNVCLALGILSKTETTTRGLRKLESYAFRHKTFQEFFAALWLASKYSNEKSKMYKCIKSYRDLLSYEILIRFLCGFDPEAGKRFWMFVAEEVEIDEEEDEEDAEEEMKDVTDLVCKCMKEHGFDQKDQTLDQIYFCIPRIVIDEDTSKENVLLLCHVMEEYPCNVKFLHVDDCQSQLQTLCSGLQGLKLSHLPSVNENSDSLMSHVRVLQKHNKRKKRRLFYCLCCLSSASKNSNSEHRHSFEYLPSVSEQRDSGQRDSEHSESEHSDSEHSHSLSPPVLDLQKHDKLKTLELKRLSIEGLLLPVEGARITLLGLEDVSMPHHGWEQLSEYLSSCSHLEELYLDRVRCREHSDSEHSDREHSNNFFIPVLDLQKHDKLEKLVLERLSIEGLLLPLEGAKITLLGLVNVTMSHHGCEQLSESLSSCSHLELLCLDKMRCREHSDSEHSDSEHSDSEHSDREHSDREHSNNSCIPVLDLQKHDKLNTLELRWLSIEGLLLPVEGARITSLELDNVTMAHHGWEQLSGSVTSCSHLEFLRLDGVRCREHRDSCCIPVLDLQKHYKLKTLWLRCLSIEGLLLPVEGARITSLRLDNVTMPHRDCEQLSESLSSCSHLEDLDLRTVICREHRDSCCIPALALQKHDKLKTLALRSLSIEGLLLPVEGARITSLELDNVTMPHHDCEQLPGSVTSCSHLEYLYLDGVRCREHSDSSCIPVLDLQKHNKLKKLELRWLSIEGLLLPVEGARITSLELDNVTMPHHDCEQLPGSVTSCSHLEYLYLDGVRCREHSDSSCIPVLDLQKHNKLKKLELRWLSIEGLPLPVEGARITSLRLDNVTMPHRDCEQLSESLSSCSHLEDLDLRTVICREHRDSCCIPVLDLQKHDKLKKLWLRDIFIEGLLLPVEGARITSLWLVNVTMSHHGCEQLSAAFSSRPEQENWRPFDRYAYDKVICREHSDSSCLTVKDITNFIKSHEKD